MATVEMYPAHRHAIEIVDGRIRWSTNGAAIEAPAVIWSGGEAWLAALAYCREKAFYAHSMGGSPTTIKVHATALAAYATFLESEELPWDVFPQDRSLRPTYRYRGHVMRRVEAKTLARSTAASHMSVLRLFYAWAVHSGALADRSAEPYVARQARIRYTDRVGLERATVVVTSDLAIRRANRANPGVEDGCMPLRMGDRDQVLAICQKHFRPEFQMAMKLGLYSGMRIGTILGLTHTTLRKHFPSTDMPSGWFSVSVGPEHGVSTKGGVTYHPSMPEWLLKELLQYCKSVRRGVREKHAADQNKDLVFLNFQGRPLNNRSFSQDMTELRRIAKAKGLRIPRFRFHDTRATFGTAFVLASLSAGQKTNQILPRLMRLMGHASAASSLRYIQFVEDDQRIEADAEAYADYLGLPDLVTG